MAELSTQRLDLRGQFPHLRITRRIGGGNGMGLLPGLVLPGQGLDLPPHPHLVLLQPPQLIAQLHPLGALGAIALPREALGAFGRGVVLLLELPQGRRMGIGIDGLADQFPRRASWRACSAP